VIGEGRGAVALTEADTIIMEKLSTVRIVFRPWQGEKDIPCCCV
jgi:hypothetical protein